MEHYLISHIFGPWLIEYVYIYVEGVRNIILLSHKEQSGKITLQGKQLGTLLKNIFPNFNEVWTAGKIAFTAGKMHL